jgi:hypothetical protein
MVSQKQRNGGRDGIFSEEQRPSESLRHREGDFVWEEKL